MSEEPGTPNGPQDKLNFSNDVLKQAEELLKNTFSSEEYINSVYSLVCMENDFEVTMNDRLLKVESVHKDTEEVLWDKVKKISIVTNSKGPFIADVFRVLFTDRDACTVPQRNSNYSQLYDKVTAFENVNFQNVIQAMSSSGDKEFVIWEKKEGSAATLGYALFHCNPSSQPPFTLALGFNDQSVKQISDCVSIPEALEKMEGFCKNETISKSSGFTLLYPIYLEVMDTESTMHSVAYMIKEKADSNKWNFDRTGGYTGRTVADFI
jgi:hypothetical protein